jgi:hypothetical protein
LAYYCIFHSVLKDITVKRIHTNKNTFTSNIEIRKNKNKNLQLIQNISIDTMIKIEQYIWWLSMLYHLDRLFEWMYVMNDYERYQVDMAKYLLDVLMYDRYFLKFKNMIGSTLIKILTCEQTIRWEKFMIKYINMNNIFSKII